MLAPPYSSGTVMPSTPTSPILRHRSMGNWSLRSISAARGAISACANSCTASRNASISSPNWKFRPGSCMVLCPCLSLRLSLLHVVAPDDRHQRGVHAGDQLLPPTVDRKRAAFRDRDRAPGLHDEPFHPEALTLRRCQQVDLVLDG